jgi:hypothetical protein
LIQRGDLKEEGKGMVTLPSRVRVGIAAVALIGVLVLVLVMSAGELATRSVNSPVSIEGSTAMPSTQARTVTLRDVPVSLEAAQAKSKYVRFWSLALPGFALHEV